MILTKVYVAMMLVLGGTGCYRLRHTSMNGSAATRSDAQAQTAVKSLTAARCDHEVRCGEVGRGEKYMSYESCEEHIRDDWGDELRPYECARGVNASRLTTCTNAMRSESCGTVLKALGEYESCGSSAICLD
jgi:hypothetical protein